MNGRPRSLRVPGPVSWLGERLGLILFIVVTGGVLGLQYMVPNKRVLPVIAAAAIFGLAWRLEMVSGIGVLILALPFPRATVFGNTTVAFVVLLLVIWLLRASVGRSAAPRRSPFDAPLLALFICYVVSFYNVPNAEDLRQGLILFETMVATWLMFFLIASNVRERRQLQQMFNVQAFSILLICLVAVFEVTHPGQALVPGWITFFREGQSLVNFRVGSVFQDYELLCEFCSISALLVFFLLLRARSILQRTAFALLLVLLMFVMFTTVTRGGIIALAVGIAYLLWLVRRRVRLVPVTILAVAVVSGIVLMNQFVADFTPTGDLFERLSGTTVKGFVPDDRAVVWPLAWERIFEHPLIGHGPYYSSRVGTTFFYWPHSGFLFIANNIGFIGLGVFAWMMWSLFRATRPTTDDLRHPDVAQAYLLIAQAQLVVFLVDESKIEYLRSQNYEFQIWLMFGLMAAATQMLSHQRLAAAGPAPASAAPRAAPGRLSG